MPKAYYQHKQKSVLYLQVPRFSHLQKLFLFEFVKADLKNEVTCRNTQVILISNSDRSGILGRVSQPCVVDKGVYKP